MRSGGGRAGDDGSILAKHKAGRPAHLPTGDGRVLARPLNVLIGPNGSGKSNLIEALGLIHALPTDFAAAIREGGGPVEWLWKGREPQAPAELHLALNDPAKGRVLFDHRIEFSTGGNRVEITKEVIGNSQGAFIEPINLSFSEYSNGQPKILLNGQLTELKSGSMAFDQSTVAQRRDPDNYPVLTWLGHAYGAIQIFREWTFGRSTPLRQPQPTDLPEDKLLPESPNLVLLLNQIEHHGSDRFNTLLKRFFPRFERMSTRVSGAAVLPA